MPEFDSPFFGLSEGAKFGLGYDEFIDVPSPGAGQAQTWTMDGAYKYRILGFGGRLTCDATVQTREVAPIIQNQNGKPVWACYTGTGVVANGVSNFFFNATQSQALAAVSFQAAYPMPDQLWPRGCSLVFNISTIDAGDQLDRLFVWVEKYPIGGRGYPVGFFPVDT